MAILKRPKKPKKTGTYNRTEAQRRRENWGEQGDTERGYARSKLCSGEIEYPNTGDKI